MTTMTNREIDKLKPVVEAIAKTNLNINATIQGIEQDYEIVSYYDEVVLEDSEGMTLWATYKAHVEEENDT